MQGSIVEVFAATVVPSVKPERFDYGTGQVPRMSFSAPETRVEGIRHDAEAFYSGGVNVAWVDEHVVSLRDKYGSDHKYGGIALR